MLCIICMAVNDDTFNANELYVMLRYLDFSYTNVQLKMQYNCSSQLISISPKHYVF